MNVLRRLRNNALTIVVVISLLAGVIFVPAQIRGSESASSETADSESVSSTEESASLSWEADASGLPRYSRVLAQWQAEGKKDAVGTDIAIAATDFSAKSDGVTVEPAGRQGRTDTILIDAKSWVEYTVNVPKEGLYQLELSYLPLTESNIPIQIGVKTDGEYAYAEAENIQLERRWKDSKFPPDVDYRDNEIRPVQTAILEWLDLRVFDTTRSSGEPLRWYFTQGRHVIRIDTMFESIGLSGIKLASPREIKPYEQAKAEYPQAGQGAADWYTVIEAEQMTAKSEPSVQMQATRDDLASPKSNGKIKFNTMGGDRWYRGGQTAIWEFEVPEDGLYQIHLKFAQQYFREIRTFREIRIDGEVPFRELLAYPFPYKRTWQETLLKSEDGTPFEFYLTKGKHTLSMSVTTAPVTPIVEALNEVVKETQSLTRTIRLVTGVRSSDNVDKNRDWELEKSIPDINERFTNMKTKLEGSLVELQRLYGTDVNSASGIRTAIDKLEKFAKDPNELPYRPEELASIQESLSAYTIELQRQPLLIDQIHILSSGTKLPRTVPTSWEVFKNTVKTFFLTFSPDYFDYGRKDEDASITVWVNRGRDYVTLMQQMTDELFTPATGYKVNVNIMPNPQLLILSNTSGREPDVALGLDQLTPVDFAIRNALLDLSQFPDYEEVAKQFHPGALIPFHYAGGNYALPETIMFNVLFYRTDILQQLGLEVPQTWQDVYDMLPSLQQNGYDFFMQPMLYLPFFYQNGENFYTEDGMKTGLDTPGSFDAFKQWTDLFNIYGLPREVPNFYMHFRNGDIPIGISDYNTYIQLLVAAPEISGSWEIAPIPGVERDGEIQRWTGGALQSGVIFKSTENPDAAWAFLKWWTSTETQARFGNDLEMFNGIEFRWNTANLKAFQQLPWPLEHSEAIMNQYRWFKEMPNVPGGYFTTRELNFAWNRTVLENINFRESLEESIFEINRELLRKQQEFGFVDENGQVLKKLSIPQVNEPWEGD
jgi:ABC-type glycerol-3-phosphate transport system substrate-binding protein